MEDRIRALLVDPGGLLGPRVEESELSEVDWSPRNSFDWLTSEADSSRFDIAVVVLEPSGVEAFVEAKSRLSSEWEDVKWLSLISEANDQSRLSLRRCGVEECLSSPWDLSALRESILKICELGRLIRANRALAQTVEVMNGCQALTACLEFDQLYPELLDTLLHALGREKGVALFPQEHPMQGWRVAARGLVDRNVSELASALLDEGKPFHADLNQVKTVDGGPLANLFNELADQSTSVLVVPLGSLSDGRGRLFVLQEDKEFRRSDIERAELVARYGLQGLKNAELYASAKERALIDDVTGIYTVRYFLGTCENEIRRSERYESPLSLLFMDLDQFKSVNEEFGHLTGSRILRRLCALLRSEVREVDTLARYGGDEFAILLVDTDHAEAMSVANRILKSVAKTNFGDDEKRRMDLTLSIGVATYPNHASNRDDLIHVSDQAMYRAKSKGRNRISSVADLL